MSEDRRELNLRFGSAAAVHCDDRNRPTAVFRSGGVGLRTNQYRNSSHCAIVKPFPGSGGVSGKVTV
jgi:hypothetical protein